MREHAWITESAHTTLEGRLLYVRCAHCGIRRMDLQAGAEQPPSAASRLIASRPITSRPVEAVGQLPGAGAGCAPASKLCALNH
ncbi:hypothetical protein [Zhihengliuella sp.]|uniref:hypothetical protein n=1 Tax=Zhihengliuella sp. TaxID=1954483 RepID=UPI00281178BF|nr:hypothetical protein [Zhihengliuella sp.]